MRKENLSKEGTMIINAVLTVFSQREEKELTSNERNYIEGLVDMAVICGRMSINEKYFIMSLFEGDRNILTDKEIKYCANDIAIYRKIT